MNLNKLRLNDFWFCVTKTLKLSFGDVMKSVFRGTEKECDEFIGNQETKETRK
jgi:hypothetical protein